MAATFFSDFLNNKMLHQTSHQLPEVTRTGVAFPTAKFTSWVGSMVSELSKCIARPHLALLVAPGFVPDYHRVQTSVQSSVDLDGFQKCSPPHLGSPSNRFADRTFNPCTLFCKPSSRTGIEITSYTSFRVYSTLLISLPSLFSRDSDATFEKHCSSSSGRSILSSRPPPKRSQGRDHAAGQRHAFTARSADRDQGDARIPNQIIF